ncbi:GH11555 [Drosophila grimshawi]|uniref:GH11555 n=2 Tax=Drosophila grimshawi TaxID=7222 RepID=B4JBI0_DROGR|nr:GH11555 [Drosophila grimshawi]
MSVIGNRASSHKLQLSLPLAVVVVVMMLLVVVPLQPCESRYLPTRSHGDELDKLRELMLQILELSNEDPQQQQQQQQHQMRLHNEANNPLTAQRVGNSNSNSNAAWLQKLGAMGALDTEAGYGRY